MLLDIKIGVFASSGKEYLAVEVFSSAMIVFFSVIGRKWRKNVEFTSQAGLLFFYFNATHPM